MFSIETGAAVEEEASPSDGDANPSLIRNLPLWRVQWCVLPGYQSVLHVHVPHYVSLFERLLSSPRPWRFGHIYLPEGSRNLGDPGYALEPGSRAPLVGTLMEVLQAVRFPDGRLLVLAAGLCRFRVTRPRQALPYGVADVALMPDAEEVHAAEGVALSSLDAAAEASTASGGRADSPGGGLPVMAAMQAAREAAQAAAVAGAAVWRNYELADARVVSPLAVVDGANEADAQAFGRRLVGISNGLEFLPLPYHRSRGGVADAPTGLTEALLATGQLTPSSFASDDSDSDGEEVAEEAAQDLADTAAAAHATATAAAEEVLEASASQAAAATGFGELPGGELAWPPPPGSLNSVAERGVQWRPPTEEEWEEDDAGRGADGEEAALRVEARVWGEIDAVADLMLKAHGRGWALPQGLRCLRPPHTGGDGSASSARQGGAHPSYPALRRAQRLSFALANTLPAFTDSEARQALLEASSVTARLRLVSAALKQQRNRLAALAALKGLSVTGSQ